MASRTTRTATRKTTATSPVPVEPPPVRATRSKTTTKPTTTTTKPAPPATAAKKPASRKPLINRENAGAETTAGTSKIPTSKPSAAARKAAPKAAKAIESEREQIMAYLRIRPQIGEDEHASTPYLTHLSDTSVRMTDPQDSQGNVARFRVSNLPSSSIYTFSHIFPPNTIQSDFFTKTTLPLVKDVLEGQNALLFTYGVTNSGKTYTLQGGTAEGSAGIMPRSLDVIFNSIEGLHGDGRFRPVRLCGIEPSDANDAKPPLINPEPAIAEVLGDNVDVSSSSDIDIDPTAIPLDRNYEYTIWLSYAEVYNEKVYDLLASVKGETGTDVSSIPRSATNPLLLSRQALPLKPSPASDMDGAEPGSGGKYIAGLRQFRVYSAAQAKGLVKLGQLHRRVFGTLANRESSRSHGMTIIKVVRGHKGDKNDPTALQVSRLTLVDLAGSERTKHTQTSGDRLKEAGNINKSLMVLGQCMEIMRSNQRKLAISLSQEGVGAAARMDTRDVKRGLAVVPFRHSKLTEALMDYFIGDGRTVMIVNVNPYDTGYDENSHVMKFAALAREVYITPAPAPLQRIPTHPPVGSQGRVKEAVRLFSNPPPPQPQRRKVTISIGGPGSGRKLSETVLEVLEEDEPMGEANEEQDDEPINPLVDMLFDEIELLRIQLFEAEMRCAAVELETREEVIQEMEERMRNMEKMYSKRLTSELERNEMKTDAKIDMLHQAGLFASPTKKLVNPSLEESDLSDLSEEEHIVENSLIENDEDEEEGPSESIGTSDTESDRSASASPLHGKDRKKLTASPAKNLIMETVIKGGRRSTILREIRPFLPDPPMLPSDTEDAEMSGTETAETPSAANSGATIEDEDDEEADEEEEDEDYEEQDEEDEDEDDEYVPEAKPITPKGKQASTARRRSSSPKLSAPPQSKGKAAQPARMSGPRVSKLAKDLENMKLNRSVHPDDSVVILPVKKLMSRKDSDIAMEESEEDEDEYDDDDEIALVPAKKKKRQLAKRSIVTQEEIERATYEVENPRTKGAKTIRRLVS